MEKKKINNKQARRNRLCQNIRMHAVYHYSDVVKLSFTYIVSPVVIEFTEVMGATCGGAIIFYDIKLVFLL